MADHVLITAHLAQLDGRLPGSAVDELADGLLATYEHHLARGLDPTAAAAAATDEFGRPDEIVAAFVRQSPGRRTALALLMTGPILAVCWGPSLVIGHAWTWPIPRLAAIAFGVVLLVVVATLAAAATSRDNYGRARLARIGVIGLPLLDTAMLAVVVLAAPTMVWLMAVAIAASLTRIILTTRTLILWRA